MARYDKYDPLNSGFRAPLSTALTLTAVQYQNANGAPGIGPIGVSFDANGRVLVGQGAATSGIVGILVKNMPPGAMVGAAQIASIATPVGINAGDIVDVMTHGEIVDCVGLVAGTTYWADGTTGALVAGGAGGAQPGSGAGSGAGSRRIGFTVEATRLVVRMA